MKKSRESSPISLQKSLGVDTLKEKRKESIKQLTSEEYFEWFDYLKDSEKYCKPYIDLYLQHLLEKKKAEDNLVSNVVTEQRKRIMEDKYWKKIILDKYKREKFGNSEMGPLIQEAINQILTPVDWVVRIAQKFNLDVRPFLLSKENWEEIFLWRAKDPSLTFTWLVEKAWFAKYGEISGGFNNLEEKSF